MRYLALAADYDGTLALNGRVDEPTIAALLRLKESGRRLVMVTGRVLPELQQTFPRFEIFDRIVAENGALLYDPRTKEETLLVEPPPPAFAQALRDRGVTSVDEGRVIVATWVPHEKTVLQVIHEMGLELQVIFNKGAVMVLPTGVNKATGLVAGLASLGLSSHNCVGVGDAENDHAFLSICECSAAVANALAVVKERADINTEMDHGAGVVELIDMILADDLARVAPKLRKHFIPLGVAPHGQAIDLDPYSSNVLVAGSSGSGKSTLTTGILERLHAAGYGYLIIDPEGDYSTLHNVVMLGDPQRPPLVDEIVDLLKSPESSIVVNLLGIALEHRPAYFQDLLPRLVAHRARTGRPHWIVVDEAHHLLHARFAPADHSPLRRTHGMLFITVHPESVAKAVLENVNVVLAIGETPGKTIAGFCEAVGLAAPPIDDAPLKPAEAIFWRPADPGPPVRFESIRPKTERVRHSRKYAEGNLGVDNSFYFRGPDNLLNLKAHNLTLFAQMSDGVDDVTWEFHRTSGDYSTWLRDKVKDEELASEVAAIEQSPRTIAEARVAIRTAIEKRYTLTADVPSGQVD